jgi:class 3 adenylate cyclase/tetratricopeptide (TPR) repeat protein
VARAEARFCDACGHALASAPADRGDTATRPGAPAGADERAARPPFGYTPKHLAEKILTTRSALEGERKQVTVLFADCVGFTALSHRLDPEDLHAIMDGYFHRVLDAVHRYEGTVNQFTGDGVMALFGAPIAHEDHAVRAVAAALAIQQALVEFAASLKSARGLDFAIRIGLNTGPVVVGRIGDDLRMDYTAQGETVNLAARLQAAAPAGGLMISESTHRLVSGYFVTEDAGLHQLKGLPEPARGFAVTGQRTGRTRFDSAVERGLTPLVGRATELAVLRECFEKARAGRGRVVSLVGEAGVGKSRLAWELKRGLRDAPVTCLESHCLPHAEGLPFHLIVQFLQANLGLEEGEPERNRIHKVQAAVRSVDPTLEWTVPYLMHLLSLPADELEAAGLDPAQRKRRLIEALKALTLREAQHRPLVLLVEDLQWTDRSSLEFLDALVDSVAAYPVLLVCTYRTGFVPGWHDRPTHQRVILEPLSDDETARMVDELLPAPDLPPSVHDLIVRRAEGNPFFVEELATYVRERGLPEGWGPEDVPQTIHDLLTARLDRLPDSLKRTLQLASVLGREFSRAVLEAIAPPGHDLARDLAELVRLDLLHEQSLFPEVRYRFTHQLTRQVAYEALLIRSRAELHGRAGRALERLYAGRTDEILQELADQYAKSGDREQARAWQVRAGDRAASLFAYEDAATYYRRALDTLDLGQDADRSAILEKLGDAAFARGALRESLGHWRDALALVERGGERRRAADLRRKMGGAAWAAGEKEETLVHLERGLAELGDDADSPEAARLYQELGRVCVRLGDHERATHWASRALALGQRLEAPDVIAHAYNTLGVALARADRIEEGAEYARRSLETALAHQLGSVACRAYTNLAVMYTTLDPNRSAEYCREGLALASRIGDQLQQSWLYCALAGGQCTVAGDYDAGLRAAEAAIEMDARLGQRNHLPIPLIIRAQIHQCRGDYAESARYYREALGVAEAVGEPQLLVPCYEGLATIAVEQGDEAEAEAWLAKSQKTREITGWSADTFTVLPFLC